MAGIVRADLFRPPYRGRIEIMPRTCPATQRFGEVCCRMDTHTGSMRQCQFLYGMAVMVDSHHYIEGRSIGELRDMLASAELSSSWDCDCFCLAGNPDTVLPGVHPQ